MLLAAAAPSLGAKFILCCNGVHPARRQLRDMQQQRYVMPFLHCFFVTSCAGSGSADVVTVAVSFLCSRGMSLLRALRLLRQTIVIQTPPPNVLDIIHVAFQSG